MPRLARLHLSSKGEYYPGTNMQELSFKGATADIVLQGVMQAQRVMPSQTCVGVATWQEPLCRYK